MHVSPCIYGDDQIESCPDSDHYRRGPFLYQSCLVNQCDCDVWGRGVLLKEAHLETFLLSLCVKRRF